MDAKALYELVKDWPEEAKPDHCYLHRNQWSSCRTDPDPECGIADDHALALFRDSGLEFLTGACHWKKGVTIFRYRFGVCEQRVELTMNGKTFYAPTLIEAISAAIGEVSK